MPRESSALLSGHVWKARLDELLHDCIASAPDEQADRIREAGILLRQGARHARRAPFLLPDRDDIEAMLAVGAHESAVLALIGTETAFMISRGVNGNCLASAVLPDGSEETVAEASTMALALLAAYLASLVADCARMPGEPAIPGTSAGMLLN